MSDSNLMTITLGEGRKVHAEFQGHRFITDQPREDGGENSAPAPFDLFLASLGTCAGFYVLRFCQQREISTSGIQLQQRLIKDPATKKLQAIEIALQLPPSFPERYRDAVLRAADQCAVKKALVTLPDIRTRWVLAEG